MYLCRKSRAKVATEKYRLTLPARSLTVFSQLTLFAFPLGLSSSLAPPPLDNDLPVNERLEQVKACLSSQSAGHEVRAVVVYDIIQVYKTLVLSCGISLEGNCEDPKVRKQKNTEVTCAT